MKELEFINIRVSGNATKRFVKLEDYTYPDFIAISDISAVSQRDGFSIITLNSGDTFRTKMNAEELLLLLF